MSSKNDRVCTSSSEGGYGKKEVQEKSKRGSKAMKERTKRKRVKNNETQSPIGRMCSK